jgi:CHASE3 domain sensor protein
MSKIEIDLRLVMLYLIVIGVYFLWIESKSIAQHTREIRNELTQPPAAIIEEGESDD